MDIYVLVLWTDYHGQESYNEIHKYLSKSFHAYGTYVCLSNIVVHDK